MVHAAVHGHFYQPPREMPSNGCVPVEPSAAPAHDWNERITDECYRPNAAARIMDSRGRILAIVNNFELMSFDLGPTLARWLQGARPEVHDKIVAADRKAKTAVAQPFHHVIMPLATEQDRRTEMLWGLADFRARFGREAEAVWLPETGVDDATMQTLAELGVGATILMADQAATPVDPSKPYQWCSPDGRSVSIAFADQSFSHDLAFGVMGGNAEALVNRAESIARGGLGLAATDGETFGHHHTFSERTVAFGLGVLARRRGFTTGSVVAWLQQQQSFETVGVRESAWSCAHGLGRWQTDCSCSTGGRAGSNQAWRAPLRAALDVVRDEASAAYAVAGAEYFSDPWAARDGYGDVLADATSREGFCGKYLKAGVDPVVAFELLESQRHALAMYTSCAWFFHDLAGLETVLVMRHAARCLDLIRHATGQRPDLDAVLAHLAVAQSNDPDEGNGVDIWRRWVDPVRDAEAEVGAVTPSPQVAMGLVVTDAVHRAVQSRNHGDIDRARDVVRLAGHGPVLEAAQEEVYDILLAQGDHTGLESLGFDLGLAVGQLGLDRLVDSTTTTVA
jgi:alpha-amylase/alpha-mannosidase (GH57 family)